MKQQLPIKIVPSCFTVLGYKRCNSCSPLHWSMRACLHQWHGTIQSWHVENSWRAFNQKWCQQQYWPSMSQWWEAVLHGWHSSSFEERSQLPTDTGHSPARQTLSRTSSAQQPCQFGLRSHACHIAREYGVEVGTQTKQKHTSILDSIRRCVWAWQLQ
jgi:hypothetical protein